ncbi:hypothetical protein B484DRAFT_451845 [Ochromonadaceae sp. CCMP2298]|nr:hypothetical protein B484DRAFT_451845 [Ochromonadaceae sp. CCMP2298]|mmetsp:Transcript_30286/g.67026  ORF Transcript_30286/g.67026 Transcript_30286/m.67026 type:complete len:152 (-) Transcript_30286:212-667(-)|eukprot:CAMPEP_0173211506 /NCGR_PEP_ID=MMETSP1141-20130122/24270_1 /TAXON_ID=483371 /ORGANISM="non described non described, Strain CCMP2298" /LENGTH=151 /DNA_ID=CAMNT_0014138397 /DNA_START=125 /DNA_END=580 /DNA_ORIENTATION=+
MKRTAEKAKSITNDGGILKEILREGEGELIPAGKLAVVHYTGKLIDGTVFDSSKKRNQPFKFTVGARQVILGWDKGVATMRKGEICLLTCKPDYAYGSGGVGPIPPNSTLVFEVELLGWEEKPEGGTATGVIMLVLCMIFATLLYQYVNKA